MKTILYIHNKKTSADTQIKNIRQQRHNEYIISRNDDIDVNKKYDTNSKANVKKSWAEGTCLIAGDSTILGLQERRMGGKFKTRGFSGAVIEDLYYYMHPLLEKIPSHVIIMAGTNDAKNKDANQIIDELVKLKEYVGKTLPDCVVTFILPNIENGSWQLSRSQNGI